MQLLHKIPKKVYICVVINPQKVYYIKAKHLRKVQKTLL